MARKQKTTATWTQVKAKISQLDHGGLVELIRDLYAARQDNRAFLHSRFGLGENSLEPYKDTIGRWMWPDPFSREDPSTAKARQAISAYKHAVGDLRGIAELMIFFCKQKE